MQIPGSKKYDLFPLQTEDEYLVAHSLLQLLIKTPEKHICLPIEKGRRWMNVNDLVIHHRAIAFLRILLGGISVRIDRKFQWGKLIDRRRDPTDERICLLHMQTWRIRSKLPFELWRYSSHRRQPHPIYADPWYQSFAFGHPVTELQFMVKHTSWTSSRNPGAPHKFLKSPDDKPELFSTS